MYWKINLQPFPRANPFSVRLILYDSLGVSVYDEQHETLNLISGQMIFRNPANDTCMVEDRCLVWKNRTSVILQGKLVS